MITFAYVEDQKSRLKDVAVRIPVIRGIIERRILANYHIDPGVMTRMLPSPFRPQVVNGYAIGGICLIRLNGIRPRFMPIPWGIRSENAAHRIAVEWDVDGKTQEGVYIPRRDTSSRLNTWLGGTLFPGLHHHAQFTVKESGDQVSVSFLSDDHDARALVWGGVSDQLPRSSVFPSVVAASAFFARGSLGYSVTRTPGRYDGLELNCENWHVDPLQIKRVESSYFDDTSRFPKGSIAFDCALLMRNIRHEWHGRQDVCCPAT